jgi:hypothetical protein
MPWACSQAGQWRSTNPGPWITSGSPEVGISTERIAVFKNVAIMGGPLLGATLAASRALWKPLSAIGFPRSW